MANAPEGVRSMEHSRAMQRTLSNPTPAAGGALPIGLSTEQPHDGPQRLLYRPGIDDAVIREVLAAMQRRECRSKDHFAEQRSSTRHPYVTSVVLVIPCSLPGPVPEEALVAFGAWGRNLSAGGMSVLLSRQIYRIAGDSPQHEAANMASLVRKETVCFCGLPIGDAEILWIRCRIVRIRDLAGPVLEVGLQFLEKNPAMDKPGLLGEQEDESERF